MMQMKDLLAALAGLLLGLAVGCLLPVFALPATPAPPEGFESGPSSKAAADAVGIFADRTKEALRKADMERIEKKYKCELTAKQGMPKCLLQFNESEGSVNKDVKCRVMQDAMSTGRGSYVKTGSFVLDEGRIRTNPDNLEQCDILPTDTLLYPDNGQFPVCSPDNPNLFDKSLGHEDVVGIEEAVDEGRCRLTFKTSSKPEIQAYSSYLDGKAREADLKMAQYRVSLADAANSLAASSFERMKR